LKKEDVFPAIVWLFLGIIIARASVRLGLGTLSYPGSGFVPFLLGILLSACSVFIISCSFLLHSAKQGVYRNQWADIEFRKLIFLIILLFCYAMALEKVGFLVTSFLFLFIVLKTISSKTSVFSLVTAALISLSAYLVFVRFLSVELPSGILGIG